MRAPPRRSRARPDASTRPERLKHKRTALPDHLSGKAVRRVADQLQRDPDSEEPEAPLVESGVKIRVHLLTVVIERRGWWCPRRRRRSLPRRRGRAESPWRGASAPRWGSASPPEGVTGRRSTGAGVPGSGRRVPASGRGPTEASWRRSTEASWWRSTGATRATGVETAGTTGSTGRWATRTGATRATGATRCARRPTRRSCVRHTGAHPDDGHAQATGHSGCYDSFLQVHRATPCWVCRRRISPTCVDAKSQTFPRPERVLWDCFQPPTGAYEGRPAPRR